jgi:hypothetical protein
MTQNSSVVCNPFAEVPVSFEGRNQNGVEVLKNGDHLPEGTPVIVIPCAPVESTVEMHFVRAEIQRLAGLPLESVDDKFSGADRDEVLYGHTR